MEFNYELIEELIELEEKIRGKDKLEFGDPDISRFNRIVQAYKPMSISELIKYAKEMKKDYEEQHKDTVKNMQKEIDEHKKRLEKIADLIRPYGF